MPVRALETTNTLTYVSAHGFATSALGLAGAQALGAYAFLPPAAVRIHVAVDAVASGIADPGGAGRTARALSIAAGNGGIALHARPAIHIDRASETEVRGLVAMRRVVEALRVVVAVIGPVRGRVGG